MKCCSSTSNWTIKLLTLSSRKTIKPRTRPSLPQVREAMKRIFHQRARGFDSAVRSRALDIILATGVSEAELRDLLRETADPWNTEYDLYVQAVLYNLMDQDEGIK
jgi:hypothetical protein